VLSAGAARSAAPGSFVDMRPTADGGEDEDDHEQPVQHHEFQVRDIAWFWHMDKAKWAKARVITLDGEKVLKYRGTGDNWQFDSLKKNQELNLVRTVEEHEANPNEPNPLRIGQRIGRGVYNVYQKIPSAPEGFRFFS